MVGRSSDMHQNRVLFPILSSLSPRREKDLRYLKIVDQCFLQSIGSRKVWNLAAHPSDHIVEPVSLHSLRLLDRDSWGSLLRPNRVNALRQWTDVFCLQVLESNSLIENSDSPFAPAPQLDTSIVLSLENSFGEITTPETCDFLDVDPSN